MEEILKLCMRYTESDLKPVDKPNMTKVYYENNSRVAFIDEQGQQWVSPFTTEVIAVLSANGYTNYSIGVPYSNLDEPALEIDQLRWEALDATAKVEHHIADETKRQDTYKELADAKGLLPLPQEAYDLCLTIPEKGMEVEGLGGQKEVAKPIEMFTMKQDLGGYDENNSTLTFVDAHGRTLLTPFTTEIAQALQQAGYQRQSLGVWLSNGETLTDPELAAKWEALREQKSKADLNPEWLDQHPEWSR